MRCRLFDDVPSQERLRDVGRHVVEVGGTADVRVRSSLAGRSVWRTHQLAAQNAFHRDDRSRRQQVFSSPFSDAVVDKFAGICVECTFNGGVVG